MIKKINSLLQSKSIKNGMWLYLLQFFNTIIPLITIPYITRVLGRSSYGVFSIALNLMVYMQVVVEYGFGMSATRKIALNNKADNIDKTFSGVLLARVLLLAFCTIFSASYCMFNNTNKELCRCLIVLNICLVGYCVQTNWLFQGLQEMKFISLINIVSRTVSVVFIFLFVKSSSDLYLYCLFYSFSPLLSGLMGAIIAVKKYNITFRFLSRKEVFMELKDGFYVFTTQLSAKVFGAIGITFLGIFASTQDVGVFAAIQKITNVLILCWTPISQILYPMSSQHLQNSYENGKLFITKISKIVLPVFFAIAMLIGLFSKKIVIIAFGSEYAQRYYWLIPLLLWVVIAIANNLLGIQLLLGSGHDKEYNQCFQIGVACTVILNLLLIYMFEGDGASIAPMISESILMILLILQIQKIEKTKTRNVL